MVCRFMNMLCTKSNDDMNDLIEVHNIYKIATTIFYQEKKLENCLI